MLYNINKGDTKMTAEELEDHENEEWEEYREMIEVAPRLLFKYAVFSGIVNVINYFSWEAALGTAMLGFAYSVMRIGYFCCTGK